MSVSVDDLVASFSSNHIGQEAIDLAALQAQLAQTLFSASASAARQQYPSEPCTTPTACTPSNWGHLAVAGRGSVSGLMREENVRAQEGAMECDVDAEDERAVEDLLLWSNTHRAASSPISISSPDPTRPPNLDPQEPPSTSTFATTDPFYLAQLHASQNPPPVSQSVFAQRGRPAQTSPFIRAAAPGYDAYRFCF